MVIAVSAFAIMNVAIKYLKHFSAIELVFYRAIITLIISGYFIYKNNVKIKGNNTKLLVLRGIFGFLGLLFYFVTVQKLNLANAVILQYTSPIFTVLIASIVLKEKILKLQWFAFCICLSGLLMIKNFGKIEPIYFMLGILSAFFSGCAYNVIRKLKTSESANLIVFYFPLVTLPVASILLIINPQFIIPNIVDIFWLLLMGCCTQIAQFTMTIAYQKGSAARISSISYLGLGYALIFGALLFKEKPNYLETVGLAVILIGVLTNLYATKIIDLYKKARH